jgi:AcrR family transcriptional regulator
MGRLAEIHTDRGLPRGRGSLDPADVASAQRERLLRAMVAATAELGYANVRIADVVDRARVSRQSFYAQFEDKEACFLAAHADGIAHILVALAAHIDTSDPDPTAPVRGAIDAYFTLAEQEPEFAWCMLVELPAIGPAGLAARLDAHRRIAELLRAWHEATHPDRADLRLGRYAAAVGAVHDLVFAVVADPARTADIDLPSDPRAAAVDAVLTLLG